MLVIDELEVSAEEEVAAAVRLYLLWREKNNWSISKMKDMSYYRQEEILTVCVLHPLPQRRDLSKYW